MVGATVLPLAYARGSLMLAGSCCGGAALAYRARLVTSRDREGAVAENRTEPSGQRPRLASCNSVFTEAKSLCSDHILFCSMTASICTSIGFGFRPDGRAIRNLVDLRRFRLGMPAGRTFASPAQFGTSSSVGADHGYASNGRCVSPTSGQPKVPARNRIGLKVLVRFCHDSKALPGGDYGSCGIP